MHLTERELWTVFHGMVLGALFLLAFSGGFAEMWHLRGESLNPGGIKGCVRRLIIGTWAMAIVSWLTVISGTYTVYPWYRANPVAVSPGEKADLSHYPKAYLLADPATARWHTFGMEWKEHVAWLSPILATAVAFAVSRYRDRLAKDSMLRWSLMTLFVLSFVTAGIAGVLGAFINKVAPLR